MPLALPRIQITAHHQSSLHILHGVLILFTFLTILLSGVSGPGSGYWWLEVTYTSISPTLPRSVGTTAPNNLGIAPPYISTGAKSAAANLSGSWKLGGLGVCQVGQRCTSSTDAEIPHASDVRSLLIWHIIAAMLYLAAAAVNTFFLFRSGTPTRAIVMTTAVFPPLLVLMLLITMITDFIIRAGITTATDVASVETQPSFWLGLVGFIGCLAWAGVALYMRRLRAEKTAREKRRTKQSKSAESSRKAEVEARRETAQQAQGDNRGAVRGLWPW